MSPARQSKKFALKTILIIVIPIVAIGITLSVVARKILDRVILADGERATEKIVDGILRFEADYGVLPPVEGLSEVAIPTDQLLVDILTGSDQEKNPKDNIYLEGSDARRRDGELPFRNGFVDEDGKDTSHSFVDPWGNYYMVIVDADGDGKIKVPGETSPLNLKAVCWSYGEPTKNSDHRSALNNPPTDWIKSWD